MSTEHDATEFVDDSFQQPQPASSWPPSTDAAPTLEEVDSRVAEKQQKLAELKRQQEELERERASLEEVRRRQMEFNTGRTEMVQNLTRGVGLLEETELNARREAELAAKTLTDFKDSLTKIQVINEANWSKDAFAIELTRALTTVENARMEWNSARVKLPVLAGELKADAAAKISAAAPAASSLANLSFMQLCKLGLALTWPLLLLALAAIGAVAFVLIKHR
jgi:DNA repair exonuclease SbcCD ATPase subunit